MWLHRFGVEGAWRKRERDRGREKKKGIENGFSLLLLFILPFVELVAGEDGRW